MIIPTNISDSTNRKIFPNNVWLNSIEKAVQEKTVGGYTKNELEERLRTTYKAGDNEYNPRIDNGSIEWLFKKEGEIFRPLTSWYKAEEVCESGVKFLRKMVLKA